MRLLLLYFGFFFRSPEKKSSSKYELQQKFNPQTLTPRSTLAWCHKHRHLLEMSGGLVIRMNQTLD